MNPYLILSILLAMIFFLVSVIIFIRKTKKSIAVGVGLTIILAGIGVILQDSPPSAPVTYGYMPATVSNSYEWNGVNTEAPEMLRLGNSEYYLTVYRSGVGGNDGYVNTSKVENDTGVIQTSTVDSLDFDTGTCAYPHVVSVSGDIYAVSYATSTGGVGKIRTFSADDADGSIGAAYIDTLSFPALHYTWQNDIIHVTDDVYAVAYSNQSYSQGWIRTFNISDSGYMPSSFNDTVIFNSTYMKYITLERIDSNTIVLLCTGTTTGYLYTYNISSPSGDITNTAADSWAFDTSISNDNVEIKHVSGDVYAIAYKTASGYLHVKTVTITSAGAITKSFIDDLNIGGGSNPILFTINNNSVYGITYKDSSGSDGWVSTFNMSASGTIGAAVIDSLEFDSADLANRASVSWVNKSYYYIVYTGTGSDGWSCVVNITTNYGSPVLSTPQPTDGAINVHSAPWCNITIADIDTSPMDVSWFSNYTGSWVHYQTNSSCANGTYRWHFTGATIAGQKYWWRCYADDGLHNTSSSVYSFTLATGATWVNRAPTFGTPSPTNGSTNVHRYCFTNQTIYDLDGNNTLVCFWYSLSNSPYSWVKAQQNASITANTTAKDINATYAHIQSSHYYWRVTANDGHANSTSAIYNFWTGVNVTASMTFVSKTGNDANAGTIGSPLLTVQHAVRYHAVNPGDIVYIRTGNYNEMVYMYYSGTAGNPITISGYPGEHAVLDGTGVSVPTNYGLISLWNGAGAVSKSYITIQDFTIENSSEWGIRTLDHSATPSNNITLIRCVINNIWDNGVSFTQSYGTTTWGYVSDININNCTIKNIQMSHDNLRECVTFKGCKNVIFEYNFLTGCHKIILDFANNTFNVLCDHNWFNNSDSEKYTPPYEPSAAIYVDGQGTASVTAKVSNVTISNNTIWGCKQGITLASEFSGTVDNVTIENNIINITKDPRGMVTHCIFFNYATKHQYDITIKYNTLYKSDDASTGTGTDININLNTGYLHRFVIANNIFVTGGLTKYQLAAQTGITDTELTFVNNLFYHTSKASNTKFGSSTPVYGYFGTDYVRADPKFVSLSGFDFHLNQTSPAIDAASATYPISTDYDGYPRPIYAGYDIGAYEYSEGTPIITNIYPQNESFISELTPLCAVQATDLEGETMNIVWEENTTGVWKTQQTNGTVNNGTYRWTYDNATIYTEIYWWRVTCTDASANSISVTYHFTYSEEPIIFNTTIRKSGLDYFIWMGQNVTASIVDNNITNFDTALEYIAIWTAAGSWSKYYGDATGSNWNINTFDVVQTYLDNGAGNLTFDMTSNPNIHYGFSRTVHLTKKAYGYNFTGFSNQTSTQLMADVNTTSLLLPYGYWMALWNETTYKWNYWISGWLGNINQPFNKYDVIMTRIDVNKTWAI